MSCSNISKDFIIKYLSNLNGLEPYKSYDVENKYDFYHKVYVYRASHETHLKLEFFGNSIHVKVIQNDKMVTDIKIDSIYSDKVLCNILLNIVKEIT